MGFFSKVTAKVGDRLDMMQSMFSQTGALGEDGCAPGNAASLRQATQRCMRCSQGEACKKWLNIGFEEELENREPPAFCPNQALQRQMRA